MKRTRYFPAAVDGEAVVEGEERLPVAEGGPLAQAPQLVGQVAEVAGQVRVAPVDLGGVDVGGQLVHLGVIQKAFRIQVVLIQAWVYEKVQSKISKIQT